MPTLYFCHASALALPGTVQAPEPHVGVWSRGVRLRTARRTTSLRLHPRMSQSSRSPDVLIVGGGAAGLSTAIATALAGARVTVLSRDPAEAALNAAAGMLALNSEQLQNSAMRQLASLSRDMFPDYLQMLQRISGSSGDALAYRSRGDFLIPCLRDEVVTDLKLEIPGSRIIPGHELQFVEPALASDVVAATSIPGDAHVDNRELFNVLKRTCDALGVDIRVGANVKNLVTSPNGMYVDGVQLEAGELVSAGHYIVCAGAWAQRVIPSVAMTPVKGQMLCLEPRINFANGHVQTSNDILRHTVYGHDIYIIPKRNGQKFFVGATVENVGFDSDPTAGGTCYLLTNAIKLVPGFADFRVSETWAGLRPATPDRVPILGLSQYNNLSIAGGYYRNGVLLMPAAAKIAAAVALDSVHTLPKNLADLLPQFSYTRFASDEKISPVSLPTSQSSASQKEPSRSISLRTTESGPVAPESKHDPKDYPRPLLYHIQPDGSQVAVYPWSLPDMFTSGHGDMREEDLVEDDGFDLAQYLEAEGMVFPEDTLETITKSDADKAAGNRREDLKVGSSVKTERSQSKAVTSAYPGQSRTARKTNEKVENPEVSEGYTDDDGYDAILQFRGEDEDRIMSEALAKNRAFGREPHSSEGPILSLSAQEWEKYEIALEKGIKDMEKFESYFREDDPAAVATAREAASVTPGSHTTLNGVQMAGETKLASSESDVGNGYY